VTKLGTGQSGRRAESNGGIGRLAGVSGSQKADGIMRMIVILWYEHAGSVRMQWDGQWKVHAVSYAIPRMHQAFSQEPDDRWLWVLIGHHSMDSFVVRLGPTCINICFRENRKKEKSVQKQNVQQISFARKERERDGVETRRRFFLIHRIE
jgi:hypothetical protein